MDISTAPDGHVTTEDLQEILDSSADLLARANLDAAKTQDTRAALATIHQITQRLGHLHSVVTSRRDDKVLNLWESGQSQAEIALVLGVPKATVHSILAERRALASPQKKDAHARRAAEEFETEASSEIGNLFATQEAVQQ